MKDDGSLIGDLDLFHHRPYECLVLGYINSKVMIQTLVPNLKALDSVFHVLLNFVGFRKSALDVM